MKVKAMAGVCAFLLASSAGAQICKEDSINQTTDPDRFVIHDDGTVTDAQTGLMWSVCAIGQTYNEGTCAGAARSMDWNAALQAAQTVNSAGGIAGHTGWRLPNIKELGSLVEYQCHSPAINLEVFPDTPNSTFWSSTPYPGNGADGAPAQARSIYFATGSDLTPSVQALRNARLVRDQE